MALLGAAGAGVAGIVAWSGVISRPAEPQWQFKVSTGDYADRATRSVRLLEHSFYNGTGLWHMCVPVACFTKNRDWGADSLTYVLYLRWMLTRDPTVPPIMRELSQTAHAWGPADTGSSDTVMWDAIADAREYQVTRAKIALTKAEAAFRWVDSVQAAGFASGACPGIDYQWPYGHRGDLKTLETASNYIKAAVLLFRTTGHRDYLVKAERKYTQVRHYFLASSVPLYTVYVFDNGTTCRALPGHFFASVNGNMIWAGQALARATGNRGYLDQAIATSRAVRSRLGDEAGVFADLQADNDVAEPLIEAMYDLATTGHQAFAASWLRANASAAAADTNSSGLPGRFFDGPPPGTLASAWQVNGGVALAQVAAGLDPRGQPADPAFWQHATYVADGQSLEGPALRITFTGRAIAIMGTVGAGCCWSGHARVFTDGTETYDRTGVWQNMTAPSIPQPNQVLFAWRWLTAGRHVITIRPGTFDRMEGGSFFQMSGYLLVR